MRKIKVFVDAHVFDATYQGTSTYIKGIYSQLINDERFEITLAACDTDQLKNEFPDPRFKFIKLPSKSKFKRLAFDIPRLIKANNFDYAHFQYILPLRKTCRYINTIHDLLFLQYPSYFPFKYRLVNYITFRLSAMRSDIICTVSEFSKIALKTYFKINEQSIVLTPNAVEVFGGDFVNVKEKYKMGKYILFVSRFEPRKNHLLLLKAFIELGLYNEGYKLVFIGRYKDVKNYDYEKYYSSLNEQLKECVVYFEKLPVNELNSFYRYADLFVYPSFAEGFGIPPLEAAALDCKVVCSYETAMKDFSFFDRYFFNPHDLEDLKLKITGCINDENYPYASIKQKIQSVYNWKVISNDFAEVLTKSLN